MKLIPALLRLLPTSALICLTFRSTTNASPIMFAVGERQVCAPGTYSCSGDIVDVVSLP